MVSVAVYLGPIHNVQPWSGTMPRDLKTKAEDRFKAISKIHELRTPLLEAILRDLDPDKSFEKRAAVMGKQLRSAFREFREGKLSRVRAIESYLPEWQKLRKDYEARSLEALWKHSKLHPSIAETMNAWYGKSAIYDAKLKFETDIYLGWLVRRYLAPTDVGTVEQGLGGDPMPPALGTCAMPPYPIYEDEASTDALAEIVWQKSSPDEGRVDVTLNSAEAGGAWGHSLMGADFDIPAGFTSITVTADIMWYFFSTCTAAFGAAGAGGDLYLRIENPAGTVVFENYESLFSLISPVLWSKHRDGDGDTVVSGTIATPDAAARTIRVFAGTSTHTETVGVISVAYSDVSGTVNKICISAT
jgi:hypothetical protein